MFGLKAHLPLLTYPKNKCMANNPEKYGNCVFITVI